MCFYNYAINNSFFINTTLMSKINKKSDTETFQTSVPDPSLGELTTFCGRRRTRRKILSVT